MTQKVIAKVLPDDLSELRAASTASGGTALTTTAGLVSIPLGADYLSITGRNFVGAVVVRILLNPWLSIFYTVNAGGGITDISDEVQDGDSTDVSFPAVFPATGTGFIYIGAPVPFRGVAVAMGTNKNGAANTLEVKYWNGSGWANITPTDATDTGASFAATGNVTWTVPTAWTKASLSAIGDTLPNTANKHEAMYWTRWAWDVALDTTDVAQMRALNRSTAYAEYIEGQTLEVGLQDRRVACVEALTDAGTANLIVNVGAHAADEFE